MEPPNKIKMDKFKRIQRGYLTTNNKTYPIFDGINTVGRNLSAIVNIKNLNVSHNQAIIIIIDDSQQYLSDVNSTNGTYLSDSQLVPFNLYALTDNAEIKFGNLLATYSKIRGNNSSMNLETPLNDSVMTQSMTQNFYNNNTQLIVDKISHNVALDIHEEATQVVNCPNRLLNIHEVQTQVVVKPPAIKKNNDRQTTEEIVESNSSQATLINEATDSQILDAITNNTISSTTKDDCTSVIQKNLPDNDTVLLNNDSATDITNKILAEDNTKMRVEDSKSQNTETNNLNEVENTVTTIDNKNNSNDIGLNNPALTTDKQHTHFNTKNTYHDSQIASTSTDFAKNSPDDSLTCMLKDLAKDLNDDINSPSNESMDLAKDLNDDINSPSNESMDFLAEEVDSDKEMVNSKATLNGTELDTELTKSPENLASKAVCVEDTQEIGFKKKTVRPVLSNSDTDDTDIDDNNSKANLNGTEHENKLTISPENLTSKAVTIENTQEIGYKKKPVRHVLSNSDTDDTDIDDNNSKANLNGTEHENKLTISLENLTSKAAVTIESTQEIGYKKKPVRLILSNSDTDDTDIDDNSIEKCDKKRKTKKVKLTSDSDTDIENQHSKLSKSNKKIKTRHTMKSVSDSDTDIEDDTKKSLSQQKTTKFNHRSSILKSISESDSEIEIDTGKQAEQKVSTQEKEVEHISDSDTEIDKNLDETDCIPSTQDNNLDETDCIPATQDAFAAELGYKPINSQKSTVSEENFKLGLTELMDFSQNNDEMSIKENFDTDSKKNDDNDNDCYLQPTQKLELGSINDDNIFLKPTQKIYKKYSQSQSDDIFLQPTQKLDQCDVFRQPTPVINAKQTSSLSQSQNDDVYMAATQILPEAPFKEKEDIMATQDIYEQQTQKLDTVNKNVYDLKTQPLHLDTQKVTDSETQFEVPFSSQTTFQINEDPDRPQNPILRELHASLQLDQENTNNKDIQDEHKEKVDCNSEMLPKENVTVNKCLPVGVQKKRKIRSVDDVETLSEIEEFIKKSVPLSKQQTSTNFSDDTETHFSSTRLDVINEDSLSSFQSFSTIRDSGDESDKNDSMKKELKSVAEQSFAILESRNTKVKKKPKDNSFLNKIEVTMSSKRRSMNTIENKKPDHVVLPTRSKRINSSLNKNTKTVTETSVDLSTEIPEVPVTKSSRSKAQKINTTTTEQTNLRRTRRSEKSSSETSQTIKSKKGLDAAITEDTSNESNGNGKIKSINEDANNSVQLDVQFKKSRTRQTKPPSTTSESSSSENLVKQSVSDSDFEGTNEIASSNNELPTVGKRTRKVLKNEETNSNAVQHAEKRNADNSSIGKEESSKKSIKRHADKNIVPSKSTPAKRGRKTLISDSSNQISDSSATPSAGSRASSVSSDMLSNRSEPLTTPERLGRKQKPKVVFTMLDNPSLESAIQRLGGSVVDSVESSTVLVTEQVKRSRKLLIAVAQAKPICSPDWILSSKKNKEFLDPWDNILVDKQAEEKWNFSLKESLIRARNNRLLTDFTFHLIVTNAVDVLKGAIEAAGGKVIAKLPAKNVDKVIVVASPDQRAKYNKIREKHSNIKIVEPEAIFDGVLRQQFSISKHSL